MPYIVCYSPSPRQPSITVGGTTRKGRCQGRETRNGFFCTDSSSRRSRDTLPSRVLRTFIVPLGCSNRTSQKTSGTTKNIYNVVYLAPCVQLDENVQRMRVCKCRYTRRLTCPALSAEAQDDKKAKNSIAALGAMMLVKTGQLSTNTSPAKFGRCFFLHRTIANGEWSYAAETSLLSFPFTNKSANNVAGRCAAGFAGSEAGPTRRRRKKPRSRKRQSWVSVRHQRGLRHHYHHHRHRRQRQRRYPRQHRLLRHR